VRRTDPRAAAYLAAARLAMQLSSPPRLCQIHLPPRSASRHSPITQSTRHTSSRYSKGNAIYICREGASTKLSAACNRLDSRVEQVAYPRFTGVERYSHTQHRVELALHPVPCLMRASSFRATEISISTVSVFCSQNQ
jgi:hypothetical protein